ncbi:MAG: T9SS type A sorting domain-containing protein, partial [Sinomicrobium sp.]|nr:T9SS type A sorting domain-containing protein [Sinomicrobium sp.]
GSNSGHVRVYHDAAFLVYTAIPDANFEQALIDQSIDSQGIADGQVLTSDIAGITGLNISNLGIADLTGIEDFFALTNLDCSMNQLSVLDMSFNGNLININCSGNQLTALNVSNNANLRRLYCQNNQLNYLYVSENTLLQALYCQGNPLTDLDLTGLALLGVFNGSNNPALACIAVDDPLAAAAQSGLYDGWIVNDLMMYSATCGMMAKSGFSPDVKNTGNATETEAGTVAETLPKLYPNPVRDRLHIATAPGESVVRVAIYSLQGEAVALAKTSVINVEGLSKGVYFAGIQTNIRKKEVYRKIIVSGR